MKVISIVNPKGGAGKTVTAVNLAYAMSLKGKKILLIDTDPRNAVSTHLNLKNDNTNEINSNIKKTINILTTEI